MRNQTLLGPLLNQCVTVDRYRDVTIWNISHRALLLNEVPEGFVAVALVFSPNICAWRMHQKPVFLAPLLGKGPKK